MEIRFDNKIVLVTGATRGIGKAVALQFALSGATVAGHYNSNHGAAKTCLPSFPAQAIPVCLLILRSRRKLKNWRGLC